MKNQEYELKVCFLGDNTNNIDEGMKKIVHNLSISMSRIIGVENTLVINPLDFKKKDFWRHIKKFSPDIVHYVPGPSAKSLILLKIISLSMPDSLTVLSSTLPIINRYTLSLCRYIRPNIILAQSHKWKNIFELNGFESTFFPISGVDCKTFSPVSLIDKNKLREKYYIENDSFVILHVGHIKSSRNIEILKTLNNSNYKILIVGSSTTKIEFDVLNKLKGIRIIREYMSNIEDMYRISDLYIFPTTNIYNCIQIPLSVLEAMSTNLLVLSTPYGGLVDIFKEESGFIFWNGKSEGELINKVKEIANKKPCTRKLVLRYSWNEIANRLVKVYLELLARKKC